MENKSIDDKCKHVPERLYLWRVPELKKTLYMAHCGKCHTDYSMQMMEYIRAGYRMLEARREDDKII